MKALEHLKTALGGNMNVSSLTPLAISEIMEDYAKKKVEEEKQTTREWLEDEGYELLAERV